ncbi:MAG: TolC family protein [Bacteroidetes bacterium]|nr:TolC family protein [Bacteroidota bacterium]
MNYLISFSIFIFFSISFATNAQDIKSLSLKEALDLAVSNRKELVLQQLKIDQSQADMQILGARRMPTIKASGDVRYNPVLQTSIIPGAAFQTGSTPGEDREIQFGTRFNALIGLEGSYRLVDPTFKTDLDLADQDKKRSQSNWEKEKTGIQFQVAKSFFEALLQREAVQISTEQMKKAEVWIQIAEIQANNGIILPNDLLKFKRDLAVAKGNKEITERQYHQRCKELAFYTGLPVGSEIEPLGDLKSALSNNNPDLLPLEDIRNRPELIQANIAMKIASLSQMKQEQAYKPSFDFYTNVNAQHLSNDFAVWNRWFPFVFGGIRMQINLLDGGLKKKNIEKFSLEYKWQAIQLEKLQADFVYQWSSAQNDYLLALKNISIQEENIALAAQILQNDELKFKEGVTLITSLRESQLSLKEANQLKISYLADACQARLRMMNAAGKIIP